MQGGLSTSDSIRGQFWLFESCKKFNKPFQGGSPDPCNWNKHHKLRPSAAGSFSCHAEMHLSGPRKPWKRARSCRGWETAADGGKGRDHQKDWSWPRMCLPFSLLHSVPIFLFFLICQFKQTTYQVTKVAVLRAGCRFKLQRTWFCHSHPSESPGSRSVYFSKYLDLPCVSRWWELRGYRYNLFPSVLWGGYYYSFFTNEKTGTEVK